ncbi:MAG: Hsp20/alpha crystallin family protein [Candidatus Brocadiales bacterium]
MIKYPANLPGAATIVTLQKEVNQLLESSFRKIPFLGTGVNLLIDVLETAEMVTVSAEIPGVDPKDVDISITGKTLTIKGEKKVEKEEKGKQYHMVERGYGKFVRTVNIPSLVEVEKAKAEYKNGILKITIPKSEEAKAKRVPIT